MASGAVQPHVAVDVNNGEDDGEAEAADQLWATIERAASPQRRNLAIVVPDPGSGSTGGGGAGGCSAEEKKGGEVVDVRRLDRRGVQRVLQRALATADSDNAKLLHGIRARFDA
jgi:hypothetical protein